MAALKLEQDAIANLFRLTQEQINPEQVVIETGFRMRRRGVELKLHLGVVPTEFDQTLIRNIVMARRWLTMIIHGKNLHRDC